jgi:hypothetical protein
MMKSNQQVKSWTDRSAFVALVLHGTRDLHRLTPKPTENRNDSALLSYDHRIVMYTKRGEMGC